LLVAPRHVDVRQPECLSRQVCGGLEVAILFVHFDRSADGQHPLGSLAVGITTLLRVHVRPELLRRLAVDRLQGLDGTENRGVRREDPPKWARAASLILGPPRETEVSLLRLLDLARPASLTCVSFRPRAVRALQPSRWSRPASPICVPCKLRDARLLQSAKRA